MFSSQVRPSRAASASGKGGPLDAGHRLWLLFEVGLEIDLPQWRDFRRALRFALPWALAQCPFILLVAHLAE